MKIIAKILVGSHLYGTNLPTSDKDYKGVYIPDFDSVVRGNFKDVIDKSTNKSSSKNTQDDVDEQYYSIQKFFKLLSTGDTTAIDMIHANEECTIITSPEWEYIVSNRSKFYTKKMQSFIGYCKNQAKKYSDKVYTLEALHALKDYLSKRNGFQGSLDDNPIIGFGLRGLSSSYPNTIEIIDNLVTNGKIIDRKFLVVAGAKYEFSTKIDEVINRVSKKIEAYGERAIKSTDVGYDTKALMHAFRAAYQIKEILETGDLKFPLSKRNVLLSIRNGEFSYNQLQQDLGALIDEIERLSSKSHLPDACSSDELFEYLVNYYKNDCQK